MPSMVGYSSTTTISFIPAPDLIPPDLDVLKNIQTLQLAHRGLNVFLGELDSLEPDPRVDRMRDSATFL